MSTFAGMIFKHIKPFFFTILLVVVLTFGQVIADLLLPNFMAHIVDKGIAKNDTTFIFRTGGIMLLVSVIGILCAITAGFFASRIALKVGTNLRKSIFSHITRFSLSEFDQIGTSSLITRTTNDVVQIQNTTFMFLRMLLRAPLMCIGAVMMAVEKDKDLSLILLGIIPVMFLIILIVSKKAIPLFRTLQKKLDKLNMVLRENLVGIRIIRAFGRERYEKERFSSANSSLTRTGIRVNRIMAVLNPAMMLSMNLLTIAIVWAASSRINAGNLLIGDMMAFLQYAMQVFMSLMMMTMMFVMLPRAFASAERINEVFSMKPQIVDTDHPLNCEEKSGALEFKEVVFRYEGAEKPSVDHVSFKVNPGETLAIVGGTGSGKSTLLNLILRFYDVESGTITIDGLDIRKISQLDLRSRISYVPQKEYLFSGTLIENIKMGKLDATEEEIQHACEVAQASGFIEEMPKQYHSFVSQSGTNLSGGQKQRLSIARALVKKTEIYLFDDSFSALDFRTDAALRSALKKEIQSAVKIIVAQRISSIIDADRILVMDKGSLIGSGTHAELIKSNEIYKEIVLSQISESEVKLHE